VATEFRWANGRTERFAEIAAEFVQLKVNVIVTASTMASPDPVAMPVCDPNRWRGSLGRAKLSNGDFQELPQQPDPLANLKSVVEFASAVHARPCRVTWMAPMTRDTLAIGFAGAFAACVIFAGIAGRFGSNDPHEFDAVLGLTPTGECADHNALTDKPLAPLALAR
jgi:hypothetical protein